MKTRIGRAKDKPADNPLDLIDTQALIQELAARSDVFVCAFYRECTGRQPQIRLGAHGTGDTDQARTIAALGLSAVLLNTLKKIAIDQGAG
jgi:hypothetical protein